MRVKSVISSLGLVSWDPYVARRATIFEFATCCWVMFKSPRIVTVNYEQVDVSYPFTTRYQRLGRRTRGGNAYHDRNATMNPSHEKVNTRPYLSKGLRTGIDNAFRLLGLISGETKSSRRKSIACPTISDCMYKTGPRRKDQ